MSDADYTNDPEAVIEQAAAHKAEADAKHETLLEAAREGEEAVFSGKTTVTLGEAEIVARTALEGRVMRKLDRIYEGDLSPGGMLDVYVDVLAAQTERVAADGVELTGSEDIRQFWRAWLDSHDVEAAASLALERVIEEPNELESEQFEDAVRGFRGQR